MFRAAGRSRRRRVFAALATLPVLTSLSACGTTLQDAQTRTVTQQGQKIAANGDPGANGDASTGGGGGGTFAGGSSGSTGSQGAGEGTGTTGGVAAAGGTAGGGATGPLKVGVIYNDAAAGSAALSAIGGGFSLGDEKGQYDAIIAHLNAGPLGGRTIEPVWYAQGGSGTASSAEAEYQAQCEYFTNDHPVDLVVIGGNNYSVNLQQCLASRHVLMLSEYNVFYDDEMFNSLAPYLYSPTLLSGSRLGLWIDGLAAAGYFDPGARVGLISFDDPLHHRAVDRGVVPALTAHGVTPVEQAFVTPLYATSDLSASQVSSAVLRFRASQVDHVLFVGGYGVIAFSFMPVAAAQGYHPRYGLNSYEYPQYLATQNPSQMANAVGVGWNPYADVLSGQAPALTSAGQECQGILNAGGFTFKDRTSELLAYTACDTFFFLRAMLNASAGSVDPATVRQAVTALGSSYDSPVGFGTDFSSGRYDGINEVRSFAYDGGCKCFTYR